MNKTTQEKKKKLLEGIVVSSKMDRVAVVKVESLRFHPLYKKRIVKSKKYFVRDEGSMCNEGSRVVFYLSQPFSKKTRYVLDRVL